MAYNIAILYSFCVRCLRHCLRLTRHPGTDRNAISKKLTLTAEISVKVTIDASTLEMGSHYRRAYAQRCAMELLLDFDDSDIF